MSDPSGRVLILIIAFGIEAVLAYPAVGVSRNRSSRVVDRRADLPRSNSALNRPAYSSAVRRAAGVVTVLLLLAVSLGDRRWRWKRWRATFHISDLPLPSWSSPR